MATARATGDRDRHTATVRTAGTDPLELPVPHHRTRTATLDQLAAPTAHEQIGVTTLSGAMRAGLARSGGVSGIAVAAAPAVTFVVADAVAGLSSAFVALAVAAPATFALQLARREPLRGALVGLAVAGACAAVAAISGEARAFFLLPTLIPAVLGLLFLGSVLVRRPITGTLFNRLVGGPADWRDDARLLRVYTVTTLVGVVLHAVNLALRGLAYLADQPALLAALGVGAVPVFAALAASTLVTARRVVTGDRAPAGA